MAIAGTMVQVVENILFNKYPPHPLSVLGTRAFAPQHHEENRVQSAV
jgi:hypothetical protein